MSGGECTFLSFLSSLSFLEKKPVFFFFSLPLAVEPALDAMLLVLSVRCIWCWPGNWGAACADRSGLSGCDAGSGDGGGETRSLDETSDVSLAEVGM